MHGAAHLNLDCAARRGAPSPYSYNGFNQLLSVTGAAGGLTSFTYDGNGNQVTKADATGTTTYSYNLDNRLVGVAAPGGVSTFEYDANGLRTKKSDSTGTRSYLLDGLSIVAEYAPDASRLVWYTQSLARIDEVLNVVNGQGKFWYETDALGSTYAMTNAAGVVVSRSSYDVFGEGALVSAGDVAQPFGFTGREQDPSGLVYARARYRNPAAPGWLTADPLSASSGRSGQVQAEPWLRSLAPGAPIPATTDRYHYVTQQPTSAVDPSGLMLVYIGGSVSGYAGSVGGTMGLGAVLAFGAGFNMGVAFTTGFVLQGRSPLDAVLKPIPFQVEANGDLGFYWGYVSAANVQDYVSYDSVCDYAGPFASLSLGGGELGVGFGPVWSVSPQSEEAFWDADPLAMVSGLGMPVGFAFSAGWSLIPAWNVTAAITKSTILYSNSQCCP